jgi:hypothetical protein
MSEVALKPEQDILKPPEINQDAAKAAEPVDLSPSSAIEQEASSTTPVDLGNGRGTDSVSDSSPDIPATNGNEVATSEIAKENGTQDMEVS